MRRGKEEKERKKDEKMPCPFGSGKSGKNIYSLSVKEHVLNKCPLHNGDEEKMKKFFQKKRRG